MDLLFRLRMINADLKSHVMLIFIMLVCESSGWMMDECCLTTHQHNLGHSLSSGNVTLYKFVAC